MTRNRIVHRIRRPPAESVAALKAFGVSTVHEASGRLGLLQPEIRPIAIGQRACGTAITVLTDAGDNLMVHAAIELAMPGDILVLATRDASTHGAVGELLVTQARAHGIAGMVLDCGVRDVAAIREMGFPVWSRAISPAGTTKERPGSVNVPIQCGGAAVNPGDVVVADDDGVTIVARDRIDAVIDAARQRDENETVLRRRYGSGEISLDVHRLREVIANLSIEELDEEPE
jgi:4-hydroxy-4-methyl-2-oxoglutarate aldolase